MHRIRPDLSESSARRFTVAGAAICVSAIVIGILGLIDLAHCEAAALLWCGAALALLGGGSYLLHRGYQGEHRDWLPDAGEDRSPIEFPPGA